jgi:WhiB family transcriptional regulator, redox-sensing transcriptional regulator
VTAQRTRRRWALTDDGIIDPIAVQMATRGARTVALTRAERQLATAPALPGQWTERALCAQAGPDAWFPDKCQRGPAAIATRICARWPMQAQCLEHALSGADTWDGIATGIWSGTTPQERDQLQQQHKTVAA